MKTVVIENTLLKISNSEHIKLTFLSKKADSAHMEYEGSMGFEKYRKERGEIVDACNDFATSLLKKYNGVKVEVFRFAQ